MSQVESQHAGTSNHRPPPRSLAACIAQAMAYWGHRVSRDYVAALSGGAFSPVVPAEGECGQWWSVAGNDARLEFMGYPLGFTVEPAPEEALRDEAGAAAFGRRAACALRHRGVLLCGMWPSWSVVAGDGNGLAADALLGLAGLDASTKLRADARAYILRPANRALTRREATAEALRFGAAVAVDDCPCEAYAYGGRFYDTVARAAERGRICPSCPDSGGHCAERITGRVREAQLCGARFFGRAGALLPRLRDDPCLEYLARTYRQMAEILTPYADGGRLSLLWDDPQRRGQYVRDLRRAGRLHDHAARALAHLVARL
jgi:hypothetical protein